MSLDFGGDFMQMYKPSEFAALLHVTVKTLQNWDNAGVLKAYRTPTDRRYYTEAQYTAYMQKSAANQGVVIYARVSPEQTMKELDAQVAKIRTFATEQGLTITGVYTDIASGMDYDREGWNALLHACDAGTVRTVVIAHANCFVRLGYDWLVKRLEDKQVTIINIDDASSISSHDAEYDRVLMMKVLG